MEGILPAEIVRASTASLSETSRGALDYLLLLPPKPAQFSEALGTTFTGVAPGVLDELVDSGLLEQTADDAYAVHPSIVEMVPGANATRRMEIARTILERYASSLPAQVDSPRRFADDVATMVQFLRAANDRQNMGKLTRRIAKLLYEPLDRRGLYHVAEGLLRFAVEPGEPSDADSAEVLQDLGRLLERRGRYGEAEEVLQRATAAWRKLNDPGKVAACLATMGTAALQQGDHTRAAGFYAEALKILPEGDRKRRAAVLQGLGAAHHYAGHFDDALSAYAQAYELARSSDNPKSKEIVPALLYGMCLLASSRGDRRAASKWIETGLVSCATGEQRALMLTGMGRLNRQSGDLTEAEQHLLEALSEAKRIHHPKRMAVARVELASVYRHQLRFDEAERVLAEAVAGLRNIGQKYDLAHALLETARLSLDRGDLGAANDAIAEAEQVAEDAALAEIQIEAVEARAMLAHARGEDAVATHLAEDAIRRYAEIGHYRAVAVQEWLSRLG